MLAGLPLSSPRNLLSRSVVGQVGSGQLFEQGKNVLAVIGRDEIIGVFDARGDALQIDQ